MVTLTFIVRIVAALNTVKHKRGHEPQVVTGVLEECSELLVDLNLMSYLVVEEYRMVRLVAM